MRRNYPTPVGEPGETVTAAAGRTYSSEGVEQERLGRQGSQTQAGEPGEATAVPAGRSVSSEGRDAEHSFRVQVASFAELDELTRENHKALEEVKHLIEKSTADKFPPGAKLPGADKLRELDRLVALAKALGEVAVRTSTE